MQTPIQPRSSSKASKRLGLGLVATGLLFLTSCYRIDTNLTVDNDGSGQLGYIVAFNYEAFATLDESGSSSRDEFCAEATAEQSDAPPGATVEDYDEDGYCGVQITVDVPASDNFGEALREAVDDGSGANNELQNFEITKVVDDQWNFFLSFEDSDLNGFDTASAEGSEEAEQLRIIQETLEIRYEIELPGEAGDHNADSINSTDGKTRFEWEIDPYISLDPLMAETVPSGGSSDKPEPTTTTGPATTDNNLVETDTTVGAPGLDGAESDETATDDTIGDLPFDDEVANPAVTSTGPAAIILILGMLAILAVLGGVVALVLKWPSKTATTAPGMGTQPAPSMDPPSNPFGGVPQNGPPRNGPPSAPPQAGPPPGSYEWGGPPPPMN